MKTVELKKHIVSLVEESENAKILEMVYTILEQNLQLEKQQQTPVWSILSQEEKNAIQEGLSQLENGEGIPHAQVMQKANEILGRSNT